MLPILNLGPLAIQTTGLVILLGIWVALSLVERVAPLYQVPPNQLYNLALIAILAGVIGGRLSYIAQYPAAFLASPASAISLNTGLVDPLGGYVAAGIAGAIYIQRKSLDWGRTLDSLAPGFAALLVAIGLAHLASGSHYGLPSDLPWAMEMWGSRRHPAQLYEILAALGITVLTWPKLGLVPRHVPGMSFWVLVALSAAARLFLVAFQADSPLLAAGIRSAQVTAWLALAFSLGMLNWLARRAT
ncbi:MAG: prolipoprotein diacylglyceryl transferase [Anaerolineales bacterium]|nr:prolipoprotein diacylglyceryl transferase [Anaerolineales bacterium]